MLWQINDAKMAGPANVVANGDGTISGWGDLRAGKLTNPVTRQVSSGNLTWNAAPTPGNQLRLALQTLIDPTPQGDDNPGPMSGFNPAKPYTWPVIYYQGTYNGPTDSATLTADTLFDTSEFQNPINGTFSLQFDAANRSIDLVYTPSPVPEPGTLVLTVAGIAIAGYVPRRKK